MSLERNTIVGVLPVEHKEKAKFNLRNMHVNYLQTQDARLKSRILYEGSHLVKSSEHRKNFLYKEKNEDESDYEFRVRRSTIDPWVKKIIIARQSLLFNNSHKREFIPELEIYKQNVDDKGTPADVFFFNVAMDAQIDGINWVEVDMTNYTPLFDDFGKPIPRTRADDIAENHRPFFNAIYGSQVIDWDVDESGKLFWAVIELDYNERLNDQRSDFPESLGWGFKQVSRKMWKIWTQDSWYIYILRDESKKDSYTLLDSGFHGLGEVPLVPFYGFKETDFLGWPVALPVLDHIILIYNKDSDLDWFERLSAHPIPYTIGPKKPSLLLSSKGFHLETSPEGQNASVGYLETNGAGFESLRKSMQDLRYRIYVTALSQAKKETAQVQNVEGQREDKKEFQTSLRSSSFNLEYSEKRCWLLFYKWLTGKQQLTPQEEEKIVNIQYSRDFDDSQIDVEMIKTLSELVIKEQMPIKIFIEKLIEGEIISEDIDVDEVLRMIEEDKLTNMSVGAIPMNTLKNGEKNEKDVSDDFVDDDSVV